MANWSAFFPDLLPHVIGCTDPLAAQEVRRAATEFFRRTRAWVEWLDPVTTANGVREYDLDLPNQSDVVRVERATLDGQPFTVGSFRESESNTARLPQTGNGLTSLDRKTFILDREPAAGRLVEIRVSLMPSKNATGIADRLYDQYADDILFGAKHRLMTLATTPFFNPQLAAQAKAAFDAAIATRNVDAWRGHTGNTPRARPKWI